MQDMKKILLKNNNKMTACMAEIILENSDYYRTQPGKPCLC